MTYEELLAKLNEQSRMIYANQTELIGWFNALRTVVELHKPIKVPHDYYESDLGCSSPDCIDHYHEPIKYPCQTIQAIEKELR